MTDYTKMPLGPLAPGRIGEVVKCPYCGERGLELEDFKNPAISKEKETIYLHFITIEKAETVMIACPHRIKRNSPEEIPHK